MRVNRSIWYADRKILVLLGVICAVILFLIFELFWVQAVKGSHYKGLSRNNRVRRIRLTAPRGVIFDRSGKILAENRPSFDISVAPEDIPDKENMALQLAPLLDMTSEEILARLKSKNRLPYVPVILKRDVSMETLIRIEESRSILWGVIVEVLPVRHYAFGKLASHILGYVGKISREQLEKYKDYGYHQQDMIGKMGVEVAYDEYLRGEAGGMQVQVDNRGYRDRILSRKDPVQGSDIILNLDLRLQQIVEDEFGYNNKGCVVALDPQTGEVLAMLSRPDFDPNVFVDLKRRNEVRELLTDTGHPLYNKSVFGEYAPGSPFKLIVAIDALESGKLDVSKKFKCTGKFKLGHASFRCWFKPGHGYVNIINGIKFSCNVFFYNTIKLLNIDEVAELARNFGFGSKTGIDLLGEKKGLVPDLKWKKEKLQEPWYGGDSMNFCIGQGALLVTPIQMAVMISAIANGGNIYQPALVQKIITREEKRSIFIEKKPVGFLDVSSDTLELIRKGMYKVVNDEDGTAKAARVNGIEVAGKTGTIQLRSGDLDLTHAWFVSFAPFEKPEIVLVVLVEGGKSGGRTAAPIASRIYERFFDINDEGGETDVQV
ncbi:MAG: penicillin-binding protein 2 [Candidatus Theseobacter exili]|nr:penicillin-binding protein 2 [Candidatus Theseobacter exili]